MKLRHILFAVTLLGVFSASTFAQSPNSTPLKDTSMNLPPNGPWKLLWTQPVEELKATARMFEHQQSGAPLLYLSCEDDNKVFCISFRTPPTDNTGIAHIMEHSVLCGSEKFPSKEPFVDLLKGSLQTFLNAFTSDDRTMYPVASRNDKDFRNLMDVYLDAVFFPKLMSTPEILMQEGWHYQVDDETGDLNYNGVVYNEMKGVYSSPQSVLYRTIQREMYPDSTYHNDSGGNPDAIPDLTQEMFQKFHDKFYHPTNSMIYLYGNGDIEKHLEFLDKEYLSRFDRQPDISLDIQGPTSANSNEKLRYTITVSNRTSDSVGGTVKMALSDSVALVESTPKAKAVDKTMEWDITAIPAQGSSVIEVVILANSSGRLNTDVKFFPNNAPKKDTAVAVVIPQPVFAKPLDVTAEYSIDPGDSEADKTFLSMNFLLPNDLDDVERHFGMDLLTYLLVGSEAAPVKRALLDAGIGMEIQSYFDSSILQPCFSIIVKNSNPDKKDEFFKVLDKTLRDLVAKGIDRKLIEGALNRTEFQLREFQVSGFPKGLVLNMWMLETWAYGGDPLRNLRFEKPLKSIREKVDAGFFEKLVQEYLLNNPSRGFVMLKPKPGLEQQRSEELKTKLAEVKKSFTAEQLEEIKKKQIALIERQAAPDKPEDVAKIPTLEISDIDRKAEEILFAESRNDNGFVTIANVPVDTNGVAYVTTYIKVHPTSDTWISLLSEILGRVDTENYSYADLNSEIDIHTGGISTGLSVFSVKDKYTEKMFSYDSRFTIRTKVMLPKLEKGLNLLDEVLNRSKFEDTARLKEIIQELRVGMEQSMISGGHSYAQRRASSYFSRVSQYRERIGGIEFYKFLVDLEKNFDEKKDDIVGYLKNTLQGNSSLSCVVMPEEDFNASKEILNDFYSKLSRPIMGDPIPRFDNFKEGQLNEAVVIPSRVQYVVKSGDYRKAGFEYSGKMLVLQNILRTGYLWNNVRVQGGAYGGGVAIDRSGVLSLWSYRDPHLRRTVDLYDGVADYLEKLELSEEELTKAIIATIGSLDKPLTPADKGARVAARKLSGLTQEDVQRERDEVLSTTVEDLRKFAPMFRECMKQNNICVFGSEAKLDADKELFKTTIRPIE